MVVRRGATYFLALLVLVGLFTLSAGVSFAWADLDFGDAEDPLYPTLAASNGARHSGPATFYFGANIDYEADARLTNNDSYDDGLVFISPIVYWVTNNGAPAVYANILVDYNNDGDWADTDEWVEQNRDVTAGGIFFAWRTLPLNTWMRMTLTSVPLASYAGTSAVAFTDGETEDYIFIAAPPPWQPPRCTTCHPPPEPPNQPLPPPGSAPVPPERPTELDRIVFRGGSTGMVVNWVDLTYASGETTYCRHFGREVAVPVVVPPGETVSRPVPPGTPWPDDLHISFHKDGSNGSADFGPPVFANTWNPIDTAGVMLVPKAVIATPATPESGVPLLALGGAAVSLWARRRRRKGARGRAQIDS